MKVKSFITRIAAIVILSGLIFAPLAFPLKAHAISFDSFRLNPVELSILLNGDSSQVTMSIKGDGFDQADFVEFPTWTTYGGQDDLAWYRATKQSDGKWVRTFDLLSHQKSGGNNTITHVYAWKNDGTTWRTWTTSFYIPRPLDFADVSLSTEFNPSTRRIEATLTVTGKFASKVSYVQLPTWSINNGQDDCVWYDMTNVSNGASGSVWKASIPAPENDTYCSHAYVTISGEYMCGAYQRLTTCI